jgi:hypothetical protein
VTDPLNPIIDASACFGAANAAAAKIKVTIYRMARTSMALGETADLD